MKQQKSVLGYYFLKDLTKVSLCKMNMTIQRKKNKDEVLET